MGVVYGFYMKVVSRNDPTFKDRAWVICSDNKVTRIPIPNDLILCGICNGKIETEDIYIHCQSVPDHNEITHGEVCEKCRLEHHPEVPIKEKASTNRREQLLDIIETFLEEEIVDTFMNDGDTFVPPKILQQAKEILAEMKLRKNPEYIDVKGPHPPLHIDTKYHHCPECGSESIHTTIDLMVMGLPLISAIECQDCKETNYVYDPKGRKPDEKED